MARTLGNAVPSTVENPLVPGEEDPGSDTPNMPTTPVTPDTPRAIIGTVGSIEISISSPSSIIADGTDEVTVNYRNTGDTEAIAPLLNLEATGALLRPNDQEEFTESQIQFLAIDYEGQAGVLAPGARSSFTVEFMPDGTNDEALNFTVSRIDPDETINWEEFREDLKPNYLTDEAWNVIYDNFTASIGTTAGDYQEVLVDNANYLSELGEYVADANRLVGFEFQQASDYQALAQRYSLGSFGRGRFFIGDLEAIADEDGNVSIEVAGTLRFFTLQEDGSYSPATGDYGTLTLEGESYRLEEQNGIVTVFRQNGSLDYIEDPNGNRISAEYSNGQLSSLLFDNGENLTFTYSGDRITSVTDSTGRTNSYSYDETGELLLSVTTPGNEISFTYDDNFALTSVTNSNGTQATFEYDERGRLIEESFNAGAESITYSYDDNGGVTITNASGATTEISLNSRGQVSQIQDALGRTFSVSYDTLGNPIRITAPDNSTLTSTYDDQGNLLSQINALGQRTEFTYEPNFELLESVTDPRGNAISYDYDELGNLVQIEYADGSSESFSYDEKGNVVCSLNRRGEEITYRYNPRGQLLQQENADGTLLEYTYDSRGNLTSAIDSNSGTTTFEYDDSDRLTQITDANGRCLTYTYDAGSRRTSISDNNGNTVNYTYDDAGRLASLTDGEDNLIVSYTYDDVGRLVREDKGNGTYTTYAYDPASQLTSLVNYAPDESINSRFDYSYDKLGRQVGVSTLDGDWTYTYDATSQLTGAVFDSTNPEIPDQNLSYTYDAAGNRIQTVNNGETTEYNTNNLNQYETAGDVVYDYDADGNLISKTEGNEVTTYEYNSENLLVKVVEPNGVETEYEYDALGNRIATIYDGDRTEYLIDPFGLGDVVGEYDEEGNLVANYAHGLGLESRTDESNATAFYDFNDLGSTVSLTDSEGQTLNQYAYAPFGQEVQKTEVIANPFEFVGEFGVTEEPNGLDFMRARYYDSLLGRFTSPDPIGLAGGDTNLYRYTFNSPVNYIDPSGEIPAVVLLPLIGAGSEVAFSVVDSLARGERVTVGQVIGAAFKGAVIGLFGPGVGTAGSLLGRAVARNISTTIGREVSDSTFGVIQGSAIALTAYGLDLSGSLIGTIVEAELTGDFENLNSLSDLESLLRGSIFGTIGFGSGTSISPLSTDIILAYSEIGIFAESAASVFGGVVSRVLEAQDPFRKIGNAITDIFSDLIPPAPGIPSAPGESPVFPIIAGLIPFAPDNLARSKGEPHLTTFDGVGYDFQGAGEFTLVESLDGDFNVQVRYVQIDDNVTVASAVATEVDGQNVVIDSEGIEFVDAEGNPVEEGGIPQVTRFISGGEAAVTIDGEAVSIPSGASIEVGNSRIYRSGSGRYTIVYAGEDGVVNDGDDQLVVNYTRPGTISIVDVYLGDEKQGQITGLLGNLDGNPDNDVALRDGTVLPRPLEFDRLYGEYRDDYRVSSIDESLFTYESGQNPNTFYNPNFPEEPYTYADLSPALKAIGDAAALEAGYEPGTYAFESAAFDFAVTRDPAFLERSETDPTANGVAIIDSGDGGIGTGTASIQGIKFNDLNGNGVRDTELVQGENPDVLFVIDVSRSTTQESFQGTSVGNVNADVFTDTILDAEIAGFIALNQRLIEQGLGDKVNVGIISFSGSASQKDLDLQADGIQITTTPNADTDGNGTPDVEDVLSSLVSITSTNFERALQTSEAFFNSLGTEPGNGNLIFLSDGENEIGGTFDDEVERLNNLGVNLSAFGAGESASLEDLQIIDPDAEIFTSTDELLDVFAGLNNTVGGGDSQSLLEPGLEGVSIYLDLNENGVLDDGEPSQVTDENGQYLFTNLAAGTYTVREVVPDGSFQTAPIDEQFTIELGVGETIEEINFGNTVDSFVNLIFNSQTDIPNLIVANTTGSGV
ncbi:RHS repeat-associated core domain-containing protein [Fischerella sp. PCC 9605]|uniref:RHS repeat-associated core domain-containing protein n=1 Tax=Fischerella sp. PCC 9605 TaxID=1173024 RepID=UPI00047D035E|nr:RHS repeat-associated core domain-containing protein [Fischerella sp. PCC 9605]